MKVVLYFFLFLLFFACASEYESLRREVSEKENEISRLHSKLNEIQSYAENAKKELGNARIQVQWTLGSYFIINNIDEALSDINKIQNNANY